MWVLRVMPVIVFILLCFIATNPAAVLAASLLRVAVPEMPAQLDPHRAVTDVDLAMARALFTGLVAHDAQGQRVPGAAQWQISPDGLTYTFTLRPDLKWADGQAVQAADFVAGFRRALDPALGAPFAADLFAIQDAVERHSGDQATILGVSAVNRATLKIVLKQRSTRFIDVLTRPIAMPVPRHVLAQWGDAWSTPEHLVGDGPFRPDMTEGAFALTKNPFFFAAQETAVDRVSFIPVTSADDGLAQVRNGDAHLTIGFPFELPSSRRFSRALTADLGQELFFVAVNARKDALNRRETRHALGMSIDRDALLRTLRISGAVPAYTVVAPSVLGTLSVNRAAYAGLPPAFRTAIAGVLLDEAKIDPAHPVEFGLSHAKGVVAATTARQLAAAWAKLGIKIRLEERSEVDHAMALRTGAFDLALATWPIRSATDPDGYLEPLASTSGPRNFPGYSEPDLDRRLAEADMEVDPHQRLVILSDAEGVVVQDQIILPLFFFPPVHALSRGLEGWHPNASFVHPLHFLSP